MTPRSYATPQNATKNPQIIVAIAAAVLLLLVAAGFGIRRMSADPLTGTWTRQFTNEFNAVQQEELVLSGDSAGVLTTSAGKPNTGGAQPGYFLFKDTFEWHKGGNQIAVQYRVPTGQQEPTRFLNTSAAYKFMISDDQTTLSLEGLEGDDQPAAVFTRQ